MSLSTSTLSCLQCGLQQLKRLPSQRLPVVLTLHARFYSMNNSASPRNLFEVYQKNSHWMGVYERNPVKTGKLSNEELNERIAKEIEKQTTVDLSTVIDPSSSTWSPESTRVGAIAQKIGTTVLWTKEGRAHQISMVQIKDCHILDTQLSRIDGGIDKYTQVIVGSHDITDEKYLAKMSREKVEWYDNLGVFPKQYWAGFKVTKDALLLPGTEILASHFLPGQYVSVSGMSIKRGFQGVMKRWGMKGQPKTHGQTKTHRKMGATGGGQDPGRVFPGKKMAGHTGGKRRGTPPLKLFRINTKYNVLFIKGTIPGAVGDFVTLYDCPNRKFPIEPPPFPTYFSDCDKVTEEDIYADYACNSTDPSLEFPPYKL